MAAQDGFTALVLEESDGKVTSSIEVLDDSALPDGDVTVGTEYSSTGKQLGKSVENSVKVTELESPRKFSFTGSDGKLEFLQELSLSEHDGGTRLERRTSAELNPVLAIMFKILIGPLIANPSMNKGLRKLKANLEQ